MTCFIKKKKNNNATVFDIFTASYMSSVIYKIHFYASKVF